MLLFGLLIIIFNILSENGWINVNLQSVLLEPFSTPRTSRFSILSFCHILISFHITSLDTTILFCFVISYFLFIYYLAYNNHSFFFLLYLTFFSFIHHPFLFIYFTSLSFILSFFFSFILSSFFIEPSFVRPAIGNIYTNVLFYYIDNHAFIH